MTAAALILALCVAAAAEPGFEFASPSDGAVYEGGIRKEILISGRIAGADDLPNNAEYICFALQRPPGALFESSDGRCVLLRTAIAERLPNGQPNPDARLVTVVYDMADGAASAAALQHARPPHVSPELWAKFARENPDPDRCVPAALVGFEALAARVAGAQAAVERNGAFAAKIGHKAELLVRAAKLNDALGEELRSRNAALSLRLLRVAKKVEVVKRENVPVHGEERRLAARLRRLEQEAAKPARHLEALKRDAARLDADARADAKARVAEDDKAAVMAALEAQHAGLAKLVDVVHADLRDVEIMRNLLKPK